MENEQIMQPIKQKTPIGIILILIFIGISILSMIQGSIILSIFSKPLFQLGPILITGPGAIIINLITIFILAAIFWGIIKKLKWGRKLAIIYYSYSLILSFINAISLFINKNMYNDYYQKAFSPELSSAITAASNNNSSILNIILSFALIIVILVYLVKKKDYFIK